LEGGAEAQKDLSLSRRKAYSCGRLLFSLTNGAPAAAITPGDDAMKTPLARLLGTALLTLALPLAAIAAAPPAYPGETLNGDWLSLNGGRSFDVKAGKSVSTSMEGNKEESALMIVSDDGEIA
jgi:hypothetical protein